MRLDQRVSKVLEVNRVTQVKLALRVFRWSNDELPDKLDVQVQDYIQAIYSGPGLIIGLLSYCTRCKVVLSFCNWKQFGGK